MRAHQNSTWFSGQSEGHYKQGKRLQEVNWNYERSKLWKTFSTICCTRSLRISVLNSVPRPIWKQSEKLEAVRKSCKDSQPTYLGITRLERAPVKAGLQDFHHTPGAHFNESTSDRQTMGVSPCLLAFVFQRLENGWLRKKKEKIFVFLVFVARPFVALPTTQS